MKERPILFSTPMVQAILDGRKTQTRRVIKPEPEGEYLGCPYGLHRFSTPLGSWESPRCPYGQPGDLLWVRETWRESWASGGPGHGYKFCIEYRATWNGNRDPQNQILTDSEMHYGGNLKKDGGLCWRPSIYMPKKYARIWLRITNVRVERVQEISDGDVAAEGVEWGVSYDISDTQFSPAQKAFRGLWDSINAKRGYSWDSNPWVWVIEFEWVKP